MDGRAGALKQRTGLSIAIPKVSACSLVNADRNRSATNPGVLQTMAGDSFDSLLGIFRPSTETSVHFKVCA